MFFYQENLLILKSFLLRGSTGLLQIIVNDSLNDVRFENVKSQLQLMSICDKWTTIDSIKYSQENTYESYVT